MSSTWEEVDHTEWDPHTGKPRKAAYDTFSPRCAHQREPVSLQPVEALRSRIILSRIHARRVRAMIRGGIRLNTVYLFAGEGLSENSL